MNTNNIKYLALLSGTAMAISLAGCGGGGADSNTTAQKLLATATAGGSWVNTGIATQSGVFTVSYDASVTSSPSDAEVGLSSGAKTDFTGFPVIVRFNTLGKIDARNGSAYAASNTVSFSANVVYHFRLAVDATNHKYSVYVTAPGGSEQTVASNYAFRTEQATVSSINTWGAYMNASSGSETVNNFTIGTTTTTTTAAATTTTAAATTTTSTAATTSTVATTTTTTSGSGACTSTVTSSSAFATAMSTVKAGDVVCVSSGVNGSGLKIAGKSGTASSPITIRASNPLGTSLASFEVNASNYVKVSGFVLKSSASTLFKIVDSTHVTVLRNDFDFTGANAQAGIITSGSGTNSDNVEVAYNTFHDHTFPASRQMPQTKLSGSSIKTLLTGSNISHNMWIHHNYFKVVAPFLDTAGVHVGDTDRETIAFGEALSQTIVTNHIVENNVFEDCDGENEIITVKTSTNVLRYNTFKNSLGSLSIRFGHDSEAYGNYFYGTGASASITDPNFETGGIRVYGINHKVYGNYMENLTGTSWRLPILIDSGDTNGTTGDSHMVPKGVQVYNNIMVNNAGGVTVGSTHYSMQPTTNSFTNNKVVGSKGTLFDLNPGATGNTFSGNTVLASGSAVAIGGQTMTSAQVAVADPMLVNTTINGFVVKYPSSITPIIKPLKATDVGTGAP